MYFKTIKINLYNKHSAKKKCVNPPPPALVCVQASFEQSSFDKMCKVLPRINNFLTQPPQPPNSGKIKHRFWTDPLLNAVIFISTAGVKVNFTCKVYRLAPVDKPGSLKKILQGRNTFRVTYMGLLKIV